VVLHRGAGCHPVTPSARPGAGRVCAVRGSGARVSVRGRGARAGVWWENGIYLR